MNRLGDVVHVSLCHPAPFDEGDDLGHVEEDDTRIDLAARNQPGISPSEDGLGADADARREGTCFRKREPRWGRGGETGGSGY